MSNITRRDFVNGTLMAAGSTMLPFDVSSQAAMAALDPSYYPPARTGLRGSHPGSNDAAHQLAWNGRADWGSTAALDEDFEAAMDEYEFKQIVVTGKVKRVVDGMLYVMTLDSPRFGRMPLAEAQ